jgi:hypothetical protein
MLQQARGAFLSLSGSCGEEVKVYLCPVFVVNEIPPLRNKKSAYILQNAKRIFLQIQPSTRDWLVLIN